MSPHELLSRINADRPVCILDVRSTLEFRAGHVPGAIHVPFWRVGRWRHKLAPHRNDTVVIYCGHGPRAYVAGAALKRSGFTDVEYLEGHMKKWRDLRLPLEVI